MIRNSFRFAVIVAVVLLTVTSAADAVMPIKLGIKGGFTNSDMRGDDAAGAKGKSGITVGVFTNFHLVKGWSFQPELLYVQKGAKGVFDTGVQSAETTVKMNYIEVPVLLKYTFALRGPFRPSVFVGPALAFVQSSKTEFASKLFDYPVSVDVDNYKEKSTDLGLVLGAGLDFTLAHTTVFFDFRYIYGLKTMWEDVNVDTAPDGEVPYYDADTGKANDMKNSTLAFMVGLMI